MTECKFSKDNTTKGHHFKECGLDYVYLLNGYEIESDPDYGDLFSIHDSESLHREIARNIVLYKKDLTWQEMRFLRKELDMTQEEMANHLSKGLRQYQRYEKKNSDPIPGEIQSLMRILYWDFYMQEPKVTEMLKRLHDSKDKQQHDLYVQLLGNNQGWQSAA